MLIKPELKEFYTRLREEFHYPKTRLVITHEDEPDFCWFTDEGQDVEDDVIIIGDHKDSPKFLLGGCYEVILANNGELCMYWASYPEPGTMGEENIIIKLRNIVMG